MARKKKKKKKRAKSAAAPAARASSAPGGENHEALHLQGLEAARKGDWQRAIRLLTRAAEMQPTVPNYHMNLGNVLQAAGRQDEAAKRFRESIRLNPASCQAHYNLGNSLKLQGDLRAAAIHFKEAIRLDARFAPAHNNLGNILKSQGQYAEAAQAFRQALLVKPDFAEARFNLGAVLLTGNFSNEKESRAGEANPAVVTNPTEEANLAEAAEMMTGFLHAVPGHARALYLLGLVRERQGRIEEAINCYQRALEIQPDFTAARINLGDAMQAAGHLPQAIAAYREVLRIGPPSAVVYNNLGTVMIKLGKQEEAVGCFRQALRLQPGHAVALSNLGAVFMERGDLESAGDCFSRITETADTNLDVLCKLAEFYEMTNLLDEAEQWTSHVLKRSPNHAAALRLKATVLRRQGKVDEALGVLTKAVVPVYNPKVAQKIHFELGRLYDRQKMSAEAFHHFSSGNEVLAGIAGTRGVNGLNYRLMVERLANRFTADWTADWSRPEGETSTEAPLFLVGFPRSGTTLLDQILDGHPHLRVVEEQSLVTPVVRAVMEFPGGYPDALASFTAEDIRRLRQRYLENLAGSVKAGPGILPIDKLPLNIVHTGLIKRLFPRARFILSIRHPYDVCLSNFMQNFNPNDAMANFFTLQDTAELYELVMGLWRQYVELFDIAYHQVSYESLVDDLESTVGEMVGFLDVEPCDSMLDYTSHAGTRGRINTPSYQQVTEPIYHRARYRWKRYTDQIAGVRDRLRPLAEYFGYTEV